VPLGRGYPQQRTGMCAVANPVQDGTVERRGWRWPWMACK